MKPTKPAEICITHRQVLDKRSELSQQNTRGRKAQKVYPRSKIKLKFTYAQHRSNIRGFDWIRAATLKFTFNEVDRAPARSVDRGEFNSKTK